MDQYFCVRSIALDLCTSLKVTNSNFLWPLPTNFLKVISTSIEVTFLQKMAGLAIYTDWDLIKCVLVVNDFGVTTKFGEFWIVHSQSTDVVWSGKVAAGAKRGECGVNLLEGARAAHVLL